jgi:hypothetical protein
MPSIGEKIVRHRRQRVKNTDRRALRLAQHDLVAATKDLKFVDIEAKFFRQADRLAVSGLEYASGTHVLSIHGRYIRNCLYGWTG